MTHWNPLLGIHASIARLPEASLMPRRLTSSHSRRIMARGPINRAGGVGVMKVLIVEDEERLGRSLRTNLLEHAHIVHWVRTCEAANDALAETGYDIIILDLGLPDGDGLDLVREWRESGFVEPVLIL